MKQLKIKNLKATVGHNRGPPQQTYYLGSKLFMKKLRNIKQKTKKSIIKNITKKNNRKIERN
jgi:hypothetical protein